MPINVNKDDGSWYTVEETIYVNSDKSAVVPEGSPDAAWQLATKGKRIPMEQARALGLVKAPKKAKEAEPEADADTKAIDAAPEDKAVKAPQAKKGK